MTPRTTSISPRPIDRGGKMKWKLAVKRELDPGQRLSVQRASSPDRRGARGLARSRDRRPSRSRIESRTPPRQIRCATSPVQPVWCEAPRPAPVSPWKYSWNWSRSRQSGSVANLAIDAVDRAAPVGVGQPDGDQPARRGPSATSRSRSRCPEPVGYSTVKSSPEPDVPVAQRLDHEVVEREPDRARASSSCRRTGPTSIRRARSRPRADRPPSVEPERRVAMAPRQRPQAVRRQEGVLRQHLAEQALERWPAARR